MSRVTYGNYTKNCATCDYWGGSREIKYPGPNASVEVDLNNWGKCYSPTWHGSRDCPCTSSCQEYRVWGPIRR